MKKIIALLFLLIIITGCSKPNGTLICTTTTNPIEGTTISSKYIATYKNNYVTNLKTIEKITVGKKSDLELYKEKIEELYKDYKDIKYYKNKISIKNKTLTSTTTINYKKIDTNKLIEIAPGNKNIIEDGKVPINKVKDYYTSNGFNCKKR